MNLKKQVYEMVNKQPYGTENLVNIGDILIPNNMMKKRSRPAKWKMRKALEFYYKNNYVDKPISVEVITNEKGKPNQLTLVDGYTRYLVLKMHQSQIQNRKVPVKYIENKDSKEGVINSN